MYHFNSIKQIEEKNVPCEIEIMLWSDRMDIVAIANIKGEVILHRLSWTRAWLLSPNKGDTVKCMSWRPDGKVLAIAYCSGEVRLVSVEDKSKLYSVNVKSNVTCLFWTQEKLKDECSQSSLTSDLDEPNSHTKYWDVSTYLPDIKPHGSYSSSTSSTDERPKLNVLQNQTELNLLAIGTEDGLLYLNIFGCFSCAVLKLDEYLNVKCNVVSVNLSDNLDTMFITVRDEQNLLKIVVVNTEILKTHSKELFTVALKHENLNSLLEYLSNTLTSVTETWENILLEMDTKLSKYAAKVPEGGVTADFLDLLMFGIYTTEIEEFLVHDLTKKGLEKFGQTLEMSYTNIQKLLLKHILKTGQNITYHLAELRGLARLEQRYNILGLYEDKVTEAILSNGSFLIKVEEMQQIINHSIINYKAFFRWLYTCIMYLIDEQIPPELSKMTQQDLVNIAEFVKNFDKIGDNKSGFIMERLGQYLVDAPLTIPPDMSSNDWDAFLQQNKCIQEHPSILKHIKEMSLVQQLKHLQTAVEGIFNNPKELIRMQFSLKDILNCLSSPNVDLRVSQIASNDSNYVTFLCEQVPASCFCLIRIYSEEGIIKSKAAYFYFAKNEELEQAQYKIMDISFYSSSVLSVLLQNGDSGVLCQFAFINVSDKLVNVDLNKPFTEQSVPKLNSYDASIAMFKNIDHMRVSQFAVSGSRKVGIVLAENRRKVRIFEMEVEDEDDEEIYMSVSTFKDTDVSMLDGSNIAD